MSSRNKCILKCRCAGNSLKGTRGKTLFSVGLTYKQLEHREISYSYLTLETTLCPTCAGALGYLVVYFNAASSLLNINKGYRMISTVLDNGLAALGSTE